MGAQPTKEEELKRAIEGVKNCLKNHQKNVQSIDLALKAQNDSVQILSMKTLDNQGDGDTESEQSAAKNPLETTLSLLSYIQGTLFYQVEALDTSFKLLDDCIQELSANYSPESATTVTADSGRGGDVSTRTKTQTDRPETFSVESERPSDGIVDLDTTHRRGGHRETSLKAEKKILISEKQGLQKKLSEKEGALIEFQDKNKRQRFEVEDLQRSIKYKEEEISRLQKNKDEIKKKFERLESENKQLNVQMSKHHRDAERIHSLEDRVRHTEEKERENRRLQNIIEDLNRKIYAFEDEKRIIRERKMLVPVQLYFQRRDELMTLVVNELSAMLDTQFQTKNLQLEIIRCENSASIQPDKPVLVLCINSSRLGTDASAAIEGVQRSGRTSLLIFHHKNIHALPNQSSDRMLTSSEFKQLGGIFDLAFLSGKGIYPCDMNNQALACIDSFIQRNIPGK